MLLGLIHFLVVILLLGWMVQLFGFKGILMLLAIALLCTILYFVGFAAIIFCVVQLVVSVIGVFL